MLLPIFLAIVCCGAVTLILISAIAFIQDNRFFSSAPKEALAVIKQRNKELFYGARTMGWVMMVISILMILGAGVVSIWDGFRSSYTFREFFLRFVLIFTIYKAYDMIFFDWFLLCRFHFFQHYYPETESVLHGRKYGFNLKSQLLKLLIIFPAAAGVENQRFPLPLFRILVTVTDHHEIIRSQIFWKVIYLMHDKDAKSSQLEIQKFRQSFSPFFIRISPYGIDGAIDCS